MCIRDRQSTAEERALALAVRALASARRLLAGPDGPWTLAIVLALGAVLCGASGLTVVILARWRGARVAGRGDLARPP